MATKKFFIETVVGVKDTTTREVKKIVGSVRRDFAGLKGLGSKLGLGKLTGIGAALGAVTSAISARAVIEQLKGVTESLHELDEASKKAGVDAGTLSAIGYAARDTGVEMSALTQAMGVFAQNITMSKVGAGKLFSLFKNNAKGGALGFLQGADSPEEALLRLSDVVRAAKTTGERWALVRAAMGKGGAALIPMLLQGRDAIKAQMDESRRANPITDEMIERTRKLHDAQLRLSAVITGVKNRIATDLMPVITPLIERFVAWVQAHKDAIATKIEDTLKAIGDALKWIYDNAEYVKYALYVVGGIKMLEVIGGLGAMIGAASGTGGTGLLGVAAAAGAVLLTMQAIDKLYREITGESFVEDVSRGMQKVFAPSSVRDVPMMPLARAPKTAAEIGRTQVFNASLSPGASLDGLIRLQVELTPDLQTRRVYTATGRGPEIRPEIGTRSAGGPR